MGSRAVYVNNRSTDVVWFLSQNPATSAGPLAHPTATLAPVGILRCLCGGQGRARGKAPLPMRRRA